MTVMEKGAQAEFLVVCLCAEWCGTCREFRPEFESLQNRYPAVEFMWVDVEDQPDVVADIDVENFPTFVIQRKNLVMFCGPTQPQVSLVKRLIDTYLVQDMHEAQAYARGNPERLQWQMLADIRSRL